MTNALQTPWWRGTRGEWYAVAQVGFIALVAFGPRTLPSLPAFPFPRATLLAGAGLTLAGGCLFVAGLLALGHNLTPLPAPKPGATLVRNGPYRLVRHPIYAGGLLACFGWALLVQGWLTLAFAAALFVFFDLKARREERWLVERYPDYADYQRRVRKLIPFVY
jgi:protein-S-isoprenylcysteine O-methyltransferase Ste14